ncbi:MAG: ferritin-like domain-containing protein [Planctomycetes bacterium]|nr:ferritin-like domain-containing protein [Planctomycetota bacterium]
MLLSREEMRHDFGGARFRLPRDRDALAWIFSQFLYGEVTGIQCGYWLHRAPDLESAQFLAQQSVEEMAHIQQFLRLLERLGAPPGPAHPAVKFLSSSFMGASFAEHTCLEMAAGEGFVLMVFYALAGTIDDAGIARVLEAAVIQEERHVAFGEHWTRNAIATNPSLARQLLGLSLVSLATIRQLAKRLPRHLPMDHEVLRQLPAFLNKTCAVAELRLQRMGVLRSGTLDDLGAFSRAALIAYGGAAHGLRALLPKGKKLTKTYLDDPLVRARSTH